MARAVKSNSKMKTLHNFGSSFMGISSFRVPVSVSRKQVRVSSIIRLDYLRPVN